MPTSEDVRNILGVATSRQEVAYFFDQLQSPDWIPALREFGVFGNPPAPIEQGGGVMFPGWPASGYLLRVAADAPAEVVAVLHEIKETDNPRVWWDIVRALDKLPVGETVDFLPHIVRWIHSPYRLGVDRSAAQLANRLVDAELGPEAVSLLQSLAMLATPTDWPAGEPWAPLDDYEYEEIVPSLARRLAAVAPDVVTALAGEWQRWFDSAGADEIRGIRYSMLWRPAIEDHEQNWNHEHRENALVVAIRDASAIRVAADPNELEAQVRILLAHPSVVLKRIAIHLLAEYGGADLDLVGSVVLDEDLLADTEFHHELYRLLHSHFARLSRDDQGRYLEAVDRITTELANDESREDREFLAKLSTRRLLSPIEHELEGQAKGRYEALIAEFGKPDHPDFLSFHTSWTGPTSPLSSAELSALSADELVAYLESFEPKGEFGPAPSREGLARAVSEAAKADPGRLAPIAPRLATLQPTYAGWLLMGLRDAIHADTPFDLTPAIDLCVRIVARKVEDSDSESEASRDDGSWSAARLDAARFLQSIVEDRPAQLGADEDDRVWRTIARLLEDPDPTPEAEARYGPPNMDPASYSLNTTRGAAIHAAVEYCVWRRRHSQAPDPWRLGKDFPSGSRALEAHLEADADPSLAIAGALGLNLSRLVSLDSAWVSDQIGRLLGDLTRPRERAAWGAYLMGSRPVAATYGILRDFFERYAIYLATLDGRPGERTGQFESAERFIDHLVVLDVRGLLPEKGGPIATLLDSGKPWLIEAIVDQGGRVAHNSGELDGPIAAAFRDLWEAVRAASTNLSEEQRLTALGGFVWWFASKLDPTWSLAELVRLLEGRVSLDPEFLVFPRLREVGAADVPQAIRALELLAPSGDEPWSIRAHESDIEDILRLGLAADPMTSARAEALVHSFGRHGLLGLGGLLAPTE